MNHNVINRISEQPIRLYSIPWADVERSVSWENTYEPDCLEGARRSARNQLRYARSRYVLRRVLSHFHGSAAPEDWLFDVDAWGKPHVSLRLGAGAEACRLLHVSISHSKRMWCGAVAAVPVGVDVEDVRPVAAVAIAKRHFTAVEYQHIRAIAETQGEKAAGEYFWSLWTWKEAYCKAWGQGLRWSNMRAISLQPSASNWHAKRQRAGLPLACGVLLQDTSWPYRIACAWRITRSKDCLEEGYQLPGVDYWSGEFAQAPISQFHLSRLSFPLSQHVIMEASS